MSNVKPLIRAAGKSKDLRKRQGAGAYGRLLSDIVKLYRHARRALARAYWEIGKRIVEVEQRGKLRAPYGKRLLNKLSADLTRLCGPGFSVPNLQRMRLAYLQNPIYSTSNKLAWSQQLEIRRVRDHTKRAALERQVLRRGLPVRKIRRIVNMPGYKNTGCLPGLLTPLKGRLFTYRIIEDGGVPALDLGFAKYRNLTAAQARAFSAGDIVLRQGSGKLEKLKNAAGFLHTYEADVIRVVDGDTIWMKIYLEGRSRPSWVKEKLRLRDLDAPERNTPEGKAAKKFVEELISGKPVLITTTKPDKWDRYLSDVFVLSAPGEEIYLNNLLLEKGHACIKTSWSLADWEE